jgi:hypothetical protein
MSSHTDDATLWEPPTADKKVDVVVAVFLHLPPPLRCKLWAHIQKVRELIRSELESADQSYTGITADFAPRRQASWRMVFYRACYKGIRDWWPACDLHV